MESVFQAWDEFIIGKKKKADVVVFRRFLEDNLFELHRELRGKTYKHGGYKSFYIRDPKVRHISKACVRDRVVHHLVSNILEQIFDSTFYVHSYSCRKEKGTHKAVEAFIKLSRKASKNNTGSLFVLKCDIKKFFASVDHEVLLGQLTNKIWDEDFLCLLHDIIHSFTSEIAENSDIPKGMPIGNLTSQLFANIYLDPFDQFMKQKLKVKYYIRYADDFVILSESREYLVELVEKIRKFLDSNLKLSLHPHKVEIRDYYLGIDFLGYVVFPNFVLPRTKTKRRIFKKIREKIGLKNFNQFLQSYLGYLKHSNSFKITQEFKNRVWFLKNG